VYVNEQRAIYRYIVHSALYKYIAALLFIITIGKTLTFCIFITLWLAWV